MKYAKQLFLTMLPDLVYQCSWHSFQP